MGNREQGKLLRARLRAVATGSIPGEVCKLLFQSLNWEINQIGRDQES